MKILLILAVIVAAGVLVVSGIHKSPKPGSVATGHSSKTITQGTTITQSSPLTSLPNPPLSCSTNASLMSLSPDYSITNMNCSPAGNPGSEVLRCNGTLLNGATNVSVNCSTPGHTVSQSGVNCRGSASNSGGNMDLTYSCFNSNHLSGNAVYSCSGVLSGYSSLGISLPLSVSCGA